MQQLLYGLGITPYPVKLTPGSCWMLLGGGGGLINGLNFETCINTHYSVRDKSQGVNLSFSG